MSRVYFSLERYGFEEVDQEYLEFIFKVANLLAKQHLENEIGVAVIGAEAMRKLNREYRGQDQPTNVLSFAYAPSQEEDFLAPEERQFYLGDIYICYDEVVREANETGVGEKEVFVRLLVHGILHLFGFDHKTKTGEERMEDLESKILSLVL